MGTSSILEKKHVRLRSSAGGICRKEFCWPLVNRVITTLRIQICPIRKGFSHIFPIFLFWGWDVLTINPNVGKGLDSYGYITPLIRAITPGLTLVGCSILGMKYYPVILGLLQAIMRIPIYNQPVVGMFTWYTLDFFVEHYCNILNHKNHTFQKDKSSEPNL